MRVMWVMTVYKGYDDYGGFEGYEEGMAYCEFIKI